MKNAVLRFEELTWKQVDSLDREKSLFVISVSPIEQHGPHLPLGMDFFNGHRIARTVAKSSKPTTRNIFLFIRLSPLNLVENFGLIPNCPYPIPPFPGFRKPFSLILGQAYFMLQ